jgi:hypothetical protein
LVGFFLMFGDQAIAASKNKGCGGIQRKINKLPDRGGEVMLKAGTYVCREPIVIDRDIVWLRGLGSATILRLDDSVNKPVLVIGQTIAEPALTRRNIRVSDLAIDGNRLNQQHECFENDCVANPIRNNGITLRRVEHVRVERITVFSARSGGLVTEKGCKQVTVDEFTTYDNHFDGLAGYKTENSLFSNLFLKNNCAAGLSFDHDFDSNVLSDVIISRDDDISCDPLDAGSVGIFMRDSHQNVFHGIQIRNMREHGIFIAQDGGDPATAATGNSFNGIVVSNSGGAGLRVNDSSCINNLVCGSQFHDNTSGCISEASPDLVQVCSAGIVCVD